MAKEMRCEKCDREFSDDKMHIHPDKAYIHKGVVICEDCLMDMGVSVNEADPWTTYWKTRTDIPG